MYDTIALYIDKSFLPKGATDFDDLLLPKLDSFKESKRIPGQFTGKHGNLRFVVNRYSARIQGSLPVWFLGDNIQTINRQKTRMAIEKLSDLLYLPMGDALVKRIDMAANLSMKYPLDLYFGRLGELSNFKREDLPNGVRYRQRRRQLEFYDKVAQMEYLEKKWRKKIVPGLYKDTHILRYEYRYLYDLPRLLKVQEIRGSSLYDDSFYQMMVENWRSGYFGIKKMSYCNSITPMDFETPTDMLKTGFYVLLQDPEKEEEFIKNIKERQRTGQLDKRQAKRLRDAIREVKERAGDAGSDEILDEMDKGIAAAATANGYGGANRKGRKKYN